MTEKPPKERISVNLEKTVLFELDEEANKFFMGNRSVALNFILKEVFAIRREET